MSWIKRLFLSDSDWKRVFAWVCVYGYGFNVMAWGPMQWAVGIWNALSATQLPGPPLIPWEQLAVMSASLTAIGTVQLFKKAEQDK